MSEQEVKTYHREQVDTFADTVADMVCAITMNYVEEAVGIARAAKASENARCDFLADRDRLPPV